MLIFVSSAKFTKLTDALVNVARRLERIETIIGSQGENLMSALDDLAKQVEANTSVEASAVQLLQGLSAQLTSSANNPSQIMVLASQLKTSGEMLAAAVVANTPAAPATTTDAVGGGDAPPGQGPAI